jgi:predicted N-acetyltransferase YhbS
MPFAIRHARPDEAAALTALSCRSKRYWGYDDAFMELARAEMEITAELIARWPTFVAERGAELVGFYVLSVETKEPMLRDLWIDPAAIRTGVGSLLWRHMLASAATEAHATVHITSDPNAAGFYERMGARRVGEVESCAIPGRMLPAFEIDVPRRER